MKKNILILQHLFQKSFWRSVIEKAHIKWAFKLGIAAAAALFIGTWLNEILGKTGPEKYVGGYWCALSAIIITFQTHLGGIFKSAWTHFFGTLLGAALGVFFAFVLGEDPFSLGVSIMIAFMICSLGRLRSSLLLTITTLTVVAILWKIDPLGNPWTFGLLRFVDSCLGIIVAMMVAYLIWPERALDKLSESGSKILLSLHQLFHAAIFGHVQKKPTVLSHEIEKKLEENFSILVDAKAEANDVPKFELWNLFHHQLLLLNDSILFLLRLDKQKLKGILEEAKKHSLLNLLNVLDLAFLELAHGVPSESIQKLDQLLQKFTSLEQSMENHPQNLETFFVFTFIVKEIAEKILNASKTLQSLQ